MEKFPKKYDHQIEKHIYKQRVENGCFDPEIAQDMIEKNGGKKIQEKFVIGMPPPNVTGVLHIGHSLFLATQDTMVRRARMKGLKTVWIPGTDHAGISTQVVVEKQIAKDGLSRHDLGREKFLHKVWNWVAYSRSTIVGQTQTMGASCDRKREQFTLSENLSRAVRKAFSNLYTQGKIYQDTYIVNWCQRCQTVLSDIEVVHEDTTGKIFYIKYFLDGKPDSLTVATTRPETIFADVALAVNPADKRYKKLIGKHVLVPIVNRSIPIIGDSSVDMTFGTGVLKITPAHDPVDFEIGKKHNLPLDVYAVDKNGVFTEICGEFSGKTLEQAYDNVITYLTEIGNVEKYETHEHKVPHCERCHTKIQPLISRQWFFSVKDGAEKSINAVKNGETAIYPERFEKTFYNWLSDIRPWCISRQLWWGHRIPVWYDDQGNKHCLDEDLLPKDGKYHILAMMVFNLIADSRLKNPFSLDELIEILYADSLVTTKGKVYEAFLEMYREKYVDDASQLAVIDEIQSILDLNGDIQKNAAMLMDILEQTSCITHDGKKYHFGFLGKGTSLRQEEDVLDTWFSSALWPFSILGWPEKTADFEEYFPNTVLETGYDILFFRIARMMIMSFENIGQTPFKNIYLHGLVRDEKGEKMSKSKGNVIDPLELIKEYGTDALRLSLMMGNTPGNDLKYSLTKIDYTKRFLTKVWNATRFVVMKFGIEGGLDYNLITEDIQQNISELNEFDSWILEKFSTLVEKVDQYESKFMYSDSSSEIIEFVWKVFCDWYIEIIKLKETDYTPKVALWVIGGILKLLHPYAPFTTESLWGHIFEGMLTVTPHATSMSGVESRTDLTSLIDIVSEIRNVKSSSGQSEVKINLSGDETQLLLLRGYHDLLLSLTKAQDISYDDADDYVKLVDGIKIGLHATKVSKAKQLEMLISELDKEREFVQQLKNIVTNPSFLARATSEVVQQKKQKLEELKEKITHLEAEIAKLKMSV